jgi:hypothetical protein
MKFLKNCSSTGPDKVRNVTKLCRLCFCYNLYIASHEDMCRTYSNNKPQATSLPAGPTCLRPIVIERGAGQVGSRFALRPIKELVVAQ